MAKKKAAGRAWRLLKLALFWARKGGVFRRGLAPGLGRLVPSYLGSLRAAAAAAAVRSDVISYGEREFSFDETPIFHFKVHRRSRSTRLLHIPCINPPAVADDDVDGIFFGRVDDERERGWLRWDVDDANSSTTEQGGGREGGERDTVVGAGGAAGKPPCRSSGSAEISGEARATSVVLLEEGEAEEERSIDTEAEEFIAKFYAQMRLQRQISLLQYNEMLARSTG